MRTACLLCGKHVPQGVEVCNNCQRREKEKRCLFCGKRIPIHQEICSACEQDNNSQCCFCGKRLPKGKEHCSDCIGLILIDIVNTIVDQI